MAVESAGESERLLHVLADTIPQLVWTAKATGELEYFNARWFEYTGMTTQEAYAPRGWLEPVHPDDREQVASAWLEAVALGREYVAELRLRDASGRYRWHLARAVPVRDGTYGLRWFGSTTDIDTHKQAEEQLTFLAHASAVLSSSLEAGEILKTIAELCVPAIADWCQIQTLMPDGRIVVQSVAHREPEKNDGLKRLVGRSVVRAEATFGSPQVIRTGRGRVLDHRETLRAVRENVADPRDRQVYELAGLGTAFIVPFVARERVLGTLHLVNVDPRTAHSEAAVRIAESLAQRAAFALDNSRAYEREHRVASELQKAMLPAQLPEHDRIELSFAYRPAENEPEVGGDWYDAFVLPGGGLAISIGDVGGHGLGAAVAMSEARQALRISALEGLSPADVIARANNVALATAIGNADLPMITAIFGVLDVERSTFTYSCAGHPPPLVTTLDGNARFLYGGGVPIGVEKRPAFPTWEVKLEPYSTIVLYTDGLIEFNRNIEQESRRLLSAIQSRVQETEQSGAEAILAEMLTNRQVDDVAILIATILPKRPVDAEIRLAAAPASARIARRFAERFARVAGLEAERAFQLELAVGEAAANAVEHAYPSQGGTFALRLSMRGGIVVGEIRDAGEWRSGPPVDNRGRGLGIMRAITRRLRVDRTPKGTSIVLEI
ncbi:MAG: SpoIIE family protein phosphatase [Candidatus Eremiobacteraeota bacterium]|nr:SpoIIE family protein phosphatase [Candidatus Eremiobacteraeota bacterium]